MHPMDAVLVVLLAYAAAGLVFAVAFIAVGVGRVDPLAANSPIRTRVIFLPGAVLLWPLLAAKWRRAPAASHKGATP